MLEHWQLLDFLPQAWQGFALLQKQQTFLDMAHNKHLKNIVGIKRNKNQVEILWKLDNKNVSSGNSWRWGSDGGII